MQLHYCFIHRILFILIVECAVLFLSAQAHAQPRISLAAPQVQFNDQKVIFLSSDIRTSLRKKGRLRLEVVSATLSGPSKKIRRVMALSRRQYSVGLSLPEGMHAARHTLSAKLPRTQRMLLGKSSWVRFETRSKLPDELPSPPPPTEPPGENDDSVQKPPAEPTPGFDETPPPTQAPTPEPSPPTETTTTPALIPGPGFTSVTSDPPLNGDASMPGANEKAIARWSSVPFQTISEDTFVGVVADHFGGIDRVEFSLEAVRGLPFTMRRLILHRS